MCLVGVKRQEKQQFGEWGINSGGLIGGVLLARLLRTPSMTNQSVGRLSALLGETIWNMSQVINTLKLRALENTGCTSGVLSKQLSTNTNPHNVACYF